MEKLKRHEAGTTGARRIVCDHIAAAIKALDGNRTTDAMIHEARKSIKKARAVWRLLQSALPAAHFRHANAQLRDAGRPLGAARDARILVAALDALVKDMPGGTDATFRRGLTEEEGAIKQDVLRGPRGIALSRQLLRRVHEYIENRSVGKQGWAVVGNGLKRAYGQGRRSFHQARARRRAAELHEWRKQVKYLHHQLAILKPLWKGPIGELTDQTGDLSERLGDDHDLAVLRRKVLAPQARLASRAQQAKILAALDRRRRALQEDALRLGARIFEEKATDFARRFGGYWRLWRHPRRGMRQA
jgi:CHAD domain-containing protein